MVSISRQHLKQFKHQPPEFSFDNQLRGGSHRAVYELDNERVLKIAVDSEAPDMNKREVGRWLFSNDSLKAYLAPVLEWAPDFSWLVMAKAETSDEARDQAAHSIPGFVHLAIADVVPVNVGLLNGGPVVVDYGEWYASKYNPDLELEHYGS